ncbi:MAG TPA: hypothetical protein VKB46_22695 [Pyrinomonadaceae bacterium]|nr:hypothetical protein [Pyrinomonadaceae bacterium]
MKPIILATLCLGVSLVATQNMAAQTSAAGSETSAQLEAKKELDEAARLYRKGDFAAAQAHSERALTLDPENKTAPYFIARTIHAQFKPGDASAENLAKAEQAITAYQRLLARFPGDDEAYKAVAYLYGDTKQESLLKGWILQRALDYSIASEKRAEAYVVLASKDWDCSFNITELPSSKVTLESKGQASIHYLKPEDPQFSQAQQCVNHGLEMAEQAISLTPENESAWSYKTNLLLEASKLAEMDKDQARKATLLQQYKVALQQTTLVSEKNQKKP